MTKPGSSSSKSKSSSDGGRTTVFGEFDNLSLEQAAPYMPNSLSFGKDLRNSRWWARDSPGWSVSRSFLQYGEVVAFSLVCQSSYDWLGMKNPHCWITELAKKHGH